MHQRRRGRNLGVLALLIGMVGVVFGLTVVKVLGLGDIRELEAYDHVARPALEIANDRAAGAGDTGPSEQGTSPEATE